MSIVKDNMLQTDNNMIRAIHQIKAVVLITLLVLLFGCGGGGGSGDSEENPSVIARAGADQSVNEQSIVTLDGTGSRGNITSYNWTQVGGPLVSLIDSDDAIANYIAPTVIAQTVLQFRLTVSDNNGSSSSDEVTHTVLPVNAPPKADAGPDQFVLVQPALQKMVTLDGSSSADSDGTIASYLWNQVEGPAVTLINRYTATPNFTAPTTTELLTFELYATDNEGATDIDEVTVSVARILFSDDFNNGDQNSWLTNVVDDSNNPSAWEVNASGYLMQKNFVESIENGGNPFAESYHRGTYSFINSGAGWTNYRLTVRATPLLDGGGEPEGNDVGVMFRRQDNDNYYRFTLNVRYGFSRLEKKVGGIFSTLAVDARGYEDGEDLNITVEANGSLIQIYVNDEPLFGAVDSDITSGTIALYCQDRAMFDDVIVTENSPAPAIVLSEPVAFSVATTVDAADPNTLAVSAVTTNFPNDGKVEFYVDGTPCETSIQELPGLHRSECFNISQGEHTLVAVLSDDMGSELARDTNTNIGVQGDYYLAVGDSITNGFGDDNPLDNRSMDGRIISVQGYEANLNDVLTSSLNYPHIVFNEGIGGDASLDALGRIDSILERHPGSTKVLILLGTVDSGKNVSESTFRDRMQSLVNTIVSGGKEVRVALIPPVFNLNGTPNNARNQLIQQYNNVIISQLSSISVGPDFYNFFLDKFDTHYADELHPNGLGYAAMANKWHDSLIP